MRMPSQREQMIAEQYVLERELIRPDTDVKKAVKCVCIFLFATLAASFALYYLFLRLGVFAYLPESIAAYKAEHSAAFVLLFVLLCYVVSGLFCLRAAIIGCVRLYQHYAPEELRRRCLFKPTCSEYTILALKKYGVVIGLIKSYVRLFKKCKGNYYMIDYP